MLFDCYYGTILKLRFVDEERKHDYQFTFAHVP